MTTTNSDIAEGAKGGLCTDADPMELALREVAGEVVVPISEGAGAVDARGVAVRVARAVDVRERRGGKWSGSHVEGGRVRSALWRAAAVSAVAHALIGVGAATIVLNRPSAVDRRDAVLTIELDAVGTMFIASAAEEPDPRAEQAAVVQAVSEPDQKTDRRLDPPEERTQTEARTDVVVQAEVVAAPERTRSVRVIAGPSLTGWIAGPHEDSAEWGSFAARDGSEVSDSAARETASTRTGRITQDGAGGTVEFAGASTESATSVVYVVDASGPMVTSMRFVLEELLRSVWRLDESQSFNVVLFREDRSGGGDRSEPFAGELVSATDANKRALARWLSGTRAEGRSNPLVGLEMALGFDPDVVFLLSRSVERSAGGVWGEGFTATMARLERLNPLVGADGRAVQIQAIAFLEDDPTGLLQAIAERHGPRDGTGYRVVRGAEELKRAAR
ncbi:MAG: hypothetical protein KF768_02035 [Phycisphaeraceae bacterium]|nr:hypothetical protein [Phycisphaeraceae bacterium]